MRLPQKHDLTSYSVVVIIQNFYSTLDSLKVRYNLKPSENPMLRWERPKRNQTTAYVI